MAIVIGWDGTKEIELSSCPFCGGDPIMDHIGNDHTKKREIRIKCPRCRVLRTDAALKHGFDWLEDIAAEAWNQRASGDWCRAGVER